MHWSSCCSLFYNCFFTIWGNIFLSVSFQEYFIWIFNLLYTFKPAFSIVARGCSEYFCLLANHLLYNLEMKILFRLFLTSRSFSSRTIVCLSLFRPFFYQILFIPLRLFTSFRLTILILFHYFMIITLLPLGFSCAGSICLNFFLLRGFVLFRSALH